MYKKRNICTRKGTYVKETLSPEEFAIVRKSYANVIQVEDFNSISEDFIKITVHDPAFQCVETREKLSSLFERAFIVASEASWKEIGIY
ncbi:hypothetical protein CWS01_09785 [Niallia nealsonii]|uniref:Uncharacterized protein n=1 Tax=Niallia nealsonii TaxID=115979 RepID=A0A2N0Z2Q7_9BACI|nr:hypothetical protein CWS01_09785 [Niallia nealsonii]